MFGHQYRFNGIKIGLGTTLISIYLSIYKSPQMWFSWTKKVQEKLPIWKTQSQQEFTLVII